MKSWLDNFEHKTDTTLNWIAESIKTNKGKGSAASFVVMSSKGAFWNNSYPETTGYIIETLLDYAPYKPSLNLTELAIAQADWLCSIQHDDGAFQGGYYGHLNDKSIFNTGQILFGLISAFKTTKDEKYLNHAQKSCHWLLKSQEKSGCWEKFSYVPDYSPSYYTRVIWPMILTNEFCFSSKIEEGVQRSLDFYESRIKGLEIESMGFRPNELAYTHTIAYTLRGFMESGFLLKKDTLFNKIIPIMEYLASKIKSDGKIAGRYDRSWSGDYQFRCLTGECQMVLNFARLGELTGNETYLNFAASLWKEYYKLPSNIPIKGLNGGIPGSYPIWGPYMRWEMPNWAAKFYLDAYLVLYRNSNH